MISGVSYLGHMGGILAWHHHRASKDDQDGQPHEHDIDHMTIVASGSVSVKCNGETETYKAPAAFYQQKGIVHEIIALEDGTTWCCIFAVPND